MKQILFRGAATALVTPMQPDGSLDLETSLPPYRMADPKQYLSVGALRHHGRSRYSH